MTNFTIYKAQRASIEHPERCEDALVLLTDDPAHAPVVVVIDGMGGHQRELADGKRLTGQDAALAIAETLRSTLADLPVGINAIPGGEAEQRAISAIGKAHQHVLTEFNEAGELAARQRLGAVMTMVILCEDGKRLLVAQVGDTRAYLLSGDELIQICVDEDNIEYLVRGSQLSARDAEKIGEVLDNYDGVHEPQPSGSVSISGNRFELYQAWRWFLIGNQALNIPAANVVINAVGLHSGDPTPETSRMEVNAGDTLLLCSDGLYKNLSVPEITALLRGQADPAQALLDAAYARSLDDDNQRHTPDDITAIVVQFAPATESSGSEVRSDIPASVPAARVVSGSDTPITSIAPPIANADVPTDPALSE